MCVDIDYWCLLLNRTIFFFLNLYCLKFYYLDKILFYNDNKLNTSIIYNA